MADQNPLAAVDDATLKELDAALEHELQTREERRAADQAEAMGEAFAAGTLPDHDRRAPEPTPSATMLSVHPSKGDVESPTLPTGAADTQATVLELTHEVDGQIVKTTKDGTFVYGK